MHALLAHLAFNDQILKVPHARLKPPMFFDCLQHLHRHKRHLPLIFLETLDRDCSVKSKQPACLPHDDLLPRHTVDLSRLLHQLPNPELSLLEEQVSTEGGAFGFHSGTGGFYFGSQVGPHLREFTFRVEKGQKEVMVVVIFRKNVNSEIDRYNIIRLYQLPQLILIYQFILLLMLLIL